MNEECDKKNTIRISKITVWKTLSGILFLLLLGSIYTGGFGLFSEKQDTIQIQDRQPSQPAQKAQPRDEPTPIRDVDMAVLIDDDTVKGDANAPVTIVEWSDFECPFCTRFYEQTLGQIDDTYIKTGKVKLVYRDFPLGFHANAQKSAEAAECAGEQGKFWEMHDNLFDNGVAGGVSSFKQFATDLGLDSTKFDECLDSGAMASEVQKDMTDGQTVGVSGTPGFVINGQLVVGAQPFSTFQRIIDAELAK